MMSDATAWDEWRFSWTEEIRCGHGASGVRFIFCLFRVGRDIRPLEEGLEAYGQPID